MNAYTIKEIDHSYLLKNFKRFLDIYIQSFNNDIWKEQWLKFPDGKNENAFDYLIDMAKRDTRWIVAEEHISQTTVGCGILEKLSPSRVEELGLPLGTPDNAFYFALYFNDPKHQGKGLAQQVFAKRIAMAQSEGAAEIWARTQKGFATMEHLYSKHGFEPQKNIVVQEGGRRSVRVFYRKKI